MLALPIENSHLVAYVHIASNACCVDLGCIGCIGIDAFSQSKFVQLGILRQTLYLQSQTHITREGGGKSFLDRDPRLSSSFSFLATMQVYPLFPSSKLTLRLRY